MAIWCRRETLDRHAVSERAILCLVVRPRTLGAEVCVGRAAEEEMLNIDWDWCTTTTMKKANATQNQRPQTREGVRVT